MKIRSYQSVWDAIADSPEEAANLKLRSQLMDAIKAYLDHECITQAEAARRLGVPRSRVSELINDRISKFTIDKLVDMAARVGLSTQMTVRGDQRRSVSSAKALWPEPTLGTGDPSLLDRQSQHTFPTTPPPIVVGRYASVMASIKTEQIQDWADSIAARQDYAVLLRKLINSTGQDLRRVDFSGYGNARRREWDGVVETAMSTPWIPYGKSGWEFGYSKRPRSQAERDYDKRRTSTPPAERAKTTFVFVTLRNWPQKKKWAKQKADLGEWKDVWAHDASDMEKWLEQSVQAQIWLAEQLAMPVSGFETLDQCWKRWEEVSDPKMTSAIFEPSIVAYRDLFKKWLEEQSGRPFMVASDSKDEALAFLSCLFQDGDSALRSKDLATVFKSAETLQFLSASPLPLIPVVCTEESEREAASSYRRHRCIVVCPHSVIDSKPDIVLDLTEA